MKRYFRIASLAIVILSVLFISAIYLIGILNDPKLEFIGCLEKYTKEELNFFSEVGFLYNTKTWKWKDGIKVSIVGQPIGEDVSLIDSIVEELNPLIFPVTIVRSNDAGNLVVDFKEDTIDRQVMGFTNYRGIHFRNSEINNVKIEIFSKSKGQCRQSCIRHEFLHALGLEHPKRRNTGTIIESLVEFTDLDMDSVKLYKYTKLDKSALKILYSNCIPIGLKIK